MNMMGVEQVRSLLMVASQLSGYPIPDYVDFAPPVVIEATDVEMAKEACNSTGPFGVLACPILGFYEWPIAEGKDARPEKVWVRSDDEDSSVNAIAVHELTHWLQWHNGYHPTECPDLFMIEYQAYTVTISYQIVYENAPIPAGYPVPGVYCPIEQRIK